MFAILDPTTKDTRRYRITSYCIRSYVCIFSFPELADPTLETLLDISIDGTHCRCLHATRSQHHTVCLPVSSLSRQRDETGPALALAYHTSDVVTPVTFAAVGGVRPTSRVPRFEAGHRSG